MLIGMILLGIVLIFLGWGIHKKKWYFLISGYNTMSKEEQAQVDVNRLAKAVALMCYLLALALVAIGIFTHYNLWNLLWMVTIFIVVMPIGFIFYTRKFYPKGMARTSSGTTPKAKKISTMISVIVLIIVGILLYFSVQPTKFDVTPKHFDISGMYGDQMNWEEIATIELIEQLPDIAARTNGSSVGSKLKGNYKLKSGEKVKLFLDKKVSTYISFKWDGKTYIINKPSKAETEELYDEMIRNWLN